LPNAIAFAERDPRSRRSRLWKSLGKLWIAIDFDVEGLGNVMGKTFPRNKICKLQGAIEKQEKFMTFLLLCRAAFYRNFL
jgi:hypothetical protein